MNKSPRIVLERLSIVRKDGEKYFRKMKEGDSFCEAYWSLVFDAMGMKFVKRKARSKEERKRGKRSS